MLLLLIVFHIVLLAVSRFIAWPENLLWPYLNLSGLSYYRDIFVLYPPFFWLTLTGFLQILGLSLTSLKLFTYLVIALTDCLVYLAAGKKLRAVIFYIPLQIFFEGNGLWVDHLLAPLFLGAYLALKTGRLFLLGLLLGLALATKQTALYFFAPVFLLLRPFRPRRLITAFIGFLIPLIFLTVHLLAESLLPFFLDSTFRYILTFHTRHPLQAQWPTIGQAITTVLVFLPALAGLLRPQTRPLTLLTLFAALGIFTRFEYFHLQPALPFLALLLVRRPLFLLFFIIFLPLFLRSFLSGIGAPTRFFTPEITHQAEMISQIIPRGSKILVLNTWDHYYFLTHTLPAGNFFVPSAPWTLDYPGIQEKIAGTITNEKPPFIIYNPCFRVKDYCYFPAKIAPLLEENYRRELKLPDGTGVFQYHPMRPP